MKKLLALLMALCMLCGVACAEEATQTISTVLVDFEIPADWELSVSLDDGSMFWGGYYPADGSCIEIVICSTWAWENFNQCTSLSDYCTIMVTDFIGVGGDNVTISEVFSEAMPDGEPLAICNISNVETFLCHRYGDIVMGIRLLNCAAYPTLDSIMDLTLPIFASVTNPDIEANRKTVVNTSAVATKAAEEAVVEDNRVQVGNFSFVLPVEVEVTDSGMMGLAEAHQDEYDLYIFTLDWEESGQEMPIGSLSEQETNFIVLAGVLLGSETAENFYYLANSGSLNLPNGQDAVYYISPSLGAISHYYKGSGFIILYISNVENYSGEELANMALSIAQSFLLDGVSEEEMKLEAEQAAAQQYVVITNSSANIRSGPGGDYAKITSAVKGDVFPLIGEDGNWYIIDVNGQNGYVSKSLSAIQ